MSCIRRTLPLALFLLSLATNLHLSGAGGTDVERGNDDDGFNVQESGIQSIEEDPLEWPFHKKNKTKPAKNETKDTCYSQKDCDGCYAFSSVCHWCAHDNACHVMGSYSGCIIGVSCGSNSSKKQDHSCQSHKTCTECSLSSTFCHWCEHDNSCHAVGSVYGCVKGVDCYSNDRCQRDKPEKIFLFPFQYIGTLPLVIIFTLGGVAICCATISCCVGVGIKGAYDDLIFAAAPAEETDDTINPTSVAPTAPEEPTVDGELGDFDDALETETDALLAPEDGGLQPPVTKYSLVEGDEMEMVSSVLPGTTTAPRQKRTSNYVRCLCGFCGVCYFILILGIVGTVFAMIYFYPKIPQYSICNDYFAWKSVVESMTSMKMQANFDILASVQNPNHLTVMLEKGTGSFSHKGDMVGTFDIPPTTSEGMTITDVMIKASFTPEKWEALSLAALYYKGHLPLDISARGTFRIPDLYNHTFDAELKDIRVNVADPNLTNRKFCACPSWNDVKNKTKNGK